MTVPTFIAAGAIVSDLSGSATTTPTPPTHQTDDILIVSVFNEGNATMSTATEGWTKIGEANIIVAKSAWFYKRATSSGTSGPTVTASGTDQFAICYVYREAVTSGSILDDATIGTAFVSTTPKTSEIDTTGGDRLVISLLAQQSDISWNTAPPPSGWTLDDEKTLGSGSAVRFTAISRTENSATTVSQVTIGILSNGTQSGILTTGIIPQVVTPSGTNIQINIGDTWKEVPAVKINIGDSWKEVVSIQQNIGDTWKEVF